MVKVGSLVQYVADPSSLFKWKTYLDSSSRGIGIVLSEINEPGTTTRRFKIRWHDGKISEEWVSFLKEIEL